MSRDSQERVVKLRGIVIYDGRTQRVEGDDGVYFIHNRTGETLKHNKRYIAEMNGFCGVDLLPENRQKGQKKGGCKAIESLEELCDYMNLKPYKRRNGNGKPSKKAKKSEQPKKGKPRKKERPVLRTVLMSLDINYKGKRGDFMARVSDARFAQGKGRGMIYLIAQRNYNKPILAGTSVEIRHLVDNKFSVRPVDQNKVNGIIDDPRNIPKELEISTSVLQRTEV